MRDYSELNVKVSNYRAFADAGVVLPVGPHKVVALVGPNNSGKTSLLRLPFDLRELIMEIVQPDNIKNICRTGAGLNTVFVANVARRFRHEGNDRPITVSLSIQPSDTSFKLPEQHKLTLKMDFGASPPLEYATDSEITNLSTKSYAVADGRIDVEGQQVGDCGAMITALQDIRNSIYIPANRHLIAGEGVEHFDVLVGGKFTDILQQWLGGGGKEQTARCKSVIADILKVLELEEFNITTDAQRGNIRFSMNNELMDTDQVGSGLLQLIQTLFTVATKNPAYVFIDEPETSLHPRLQHAFMNAIRKYSRKGVVFATHSIGLARSVADEIYSVHLTGKERTLEPFSTGSSLTELLGEMSHSVYREFGFRRVLLVEGSTDIGVFRELLRHWKADMDVLLLSLGGSNLINGSREGELREFSRLGSGIFVIIDSEKDSRESELSPERTAFKTLCEELDLDIHVLERRATENYFTEQSVRAAFDGRGRSLEVYEKLGEEEDIVQLGWTKKRNWEIARRMKKSELNKTDLGVFLARMTAAKLD